VRTSRTFRVIAALVALLFAGVPALAADPAKVLRVALPQAETGFDPAQASEVYSGAVIAAIMEPLLTFDYLARPAKLVPLTADALPEIGAVRTCTDSDQLGRQGILRSRARP